MAKILNMLKSMVINVFVAIINIFIHRDKRIILFGAWMGSKFADNSRFWFQYLHENKTRYGITRVIWVTRSDKVYAEMLEMGYEVYLMRSLKSLYWHLKSGVHVVCNMYAQTGKYKGDIIGELSLGASKIQLWHGIPIKGVGLTSNEYINSKKSSSIKQYVSSSYKKSKVIRPMFIPGGWDKYSFVSTGSECTTRCSACFGISGKYFIECGYPRNCECVMHMQRELAVLKQMRKFEKVLFYLPTFRDHETNYVHPLTNPELLDYLKSSNYLWIEKPHAATVSGNNKSCYKHENVLLLEQEFDLNVILKSIDLLVTDYSSVCLDAIYFDIPVVYYIPDYIEYKEKDRGFMVDFNESIAGVKAESIDEIVNALKVGCSENYFDNGMITKYELLKKQLYNGRKTNYQQITEMLLNKYCNPSSR